MDKEMEYLTNLLDTLGIVFEGIRREKNTFRVFITAPVDDYGLKILEDTLLLDLENLWPGELVLVNPTFPAGSLGRGKSQIMDYLYADDDDGPPAVSDYEDPPYFK